MTADGSPSPETPAAGETHDHSFGAGPPLSLGVEEELLLVDHENQLAPVSEAVLEAIAPPLADRVSAEIFAGQIELKTGICHGPEQVLSELHEVRDAVRQAGFRLMGSGLHPTDNADHPELVSKPRYEIVRKDFGDIFRTPPCGLHVHVGLPDPETAIRIANAFRVYLPVMQALSANSPFRRGADSGHASARSAEVRGYPRFDMPRRFRDYGDFCRVADQLIAAAGVEDYTYIWWDVRPHPKLGTVEVRALDVPTEVATTSALAAMIQAIAALELDRPTESAAAREALDESYFQAASHGLDSEVFLFGESPVPAREASRTVLDAIRPYARELGSEDALDEIERILREGNGADGQRRVEADGGIGALLDDLARRSA
jgi:carboxylate-amine ligase